MIRLTSLLLICFCIILQGCQESTVDTSIQATHFDPTPYVDPFIGTGFHGHTFPGATLPFGMVQLSPDTRLPGWDASSGYHASDSILYGFSHTHLSGTGIGDLGDILILPFTGEKANSLLGTFQKSSEQASPGYYRVDIQNFDVQAELTATNRVGVHRYTYPAKQSAQLLIDLGHILQANWGHKSTAGKIDIVGDRIIKGERFSSGWAYDHQVFFYAEFSSPFQVEEVLDHEEVLSGQHVTGDSLKVFLSFPSLENQQLIVKVGISPVSMEGAKKNLEAEAESWDFDGYRDQASEKWRLALQKIEIQSSEPSVLTNFYTALYHSMMAPNLAQDVNGQYRGMDKKVHQAEEGFTNYTVFSLWDTFRGLHPLMSILDTDRTNAWIQSLLQKYEEGGLLPKWPLASNYTGTMVGYPSAAVIADAINKGLTDFDTKLALEAAVASSKYQPEIVQRLAEPRARQVSPRQLQYISRMGFVPADSIDASVSYGLECAYYDWCIAQIAKYEQAEKVEKTYSERSTYYRSYFDPSIDFMRGRLANGEWREPFSPRFSDHELGEFVEGNSWQWSWFVPHDIEGLIELMGGKASFALKLDTLFSTTSELEGERASSDITGLIGQYAHGNEPSHHVAHLYNYADQAYKTQERIDQILQEFYLPTPDGIIGNEDCGQMSAWYVLNALGFYQVCPGNPTYSVGRPMIDAAKISLPEGGYFEIVVENNSLKNKYIQYIELNGERLEKPFFPHSAIRDGSILKIVMK